MPDYVVNLKNPQDTPQQIADKLNTLTYAVDADVIRGVVKRDEFDKFTKNTQKYIDGNKERMELNMQDLRWHGGGLSAVIHDSTLAGLGTVASPLSVTGSGTGTVTTVSVVTANGLSGTVANPTTTPAITLDISALDATKIANGSVSNTEFQYLDGVTSNIQTQINAKGSGTVTAVSIATANGFSGSSSGGATPALTIVAGAITPTSVNGLTISTTTGTFTLTNAKTFAVTNGLTLSGTDSTTMTFPTTSATIARTDAGQTFTGVQVMTSPSLTTPDITGLATGSGVASAATASTLMSRDASANTYINNIIQGFTTTVANVGTTTLTAASTPIQVFTGSFSQTVVLPVASTMTVGQEFWIRSTAIGNITVNSSGGNTVVVIAAGSARITCVSTSGTGTSSWLVTYNGISITSGKYLQATNTLTLSGTDGTTMTFPTTSATLARTDAANTFTGHQTIEGVTSTGATGTGKFVFDTSPTLVTPTLGVATATSINGNTFTTGTYTLTGVAGKTLTFNKSITLEGTDSTTMTFPSTSATIARTDAANTFTGASTASAWVLTSPTITTKISPTTDDGAPLGDTTHNFSDLFLATGAVLNYANGNVAVTHTSGILTMGTGTLKITNPTNTSTSVVTIDGTQTLTNKTLSGNTAFADGATTSIIVPTVDGTATGPTTSAFNSGYSSSAIGDLVYLDSSATWQKCDANTTALYNGLLGIALAVASSGNALLVALPGSIVYATAFPTFTIGSPVYMSETAGAVTGTAPTTTDAATRVVGWGVHADKLYFYPSPDYITHT